MLGFDTVASHAIGEVRPATVYTLTAEVGTFTLTGQAAGLLYHRLGAAAHGTFTFTGQSADLALRTLEAGVFTFTGQEAVMTRRTRPARTITRASTISATRTTQITA